MTISERVAGVEAQRSPPRRGRKHLIICVNSAGGSRCSTPGTRRIGPPVHALPTRREFLLAATASCAATLLADAAPADESSAIPLGFSLYGMKCLDVPTALKHCAEIGYDAVELSLMPGWPADPGQVSTEQRQTWAALLTDLNLTLPALMENLAALAAAPEHLANLARIQAAAELGHALSPGAMPLIETVLGGKPEQWENASQQLVDRLGDWSETARKADVVIAAKPHVSGVLHRPDHARWLVQQVDSPHLRLAFDYSHYQLRGLELADCWKKLAKDAIFVHVKDSRGDAAKFEFLLPGDGGSIDYRTYLRMLAESKYSGCVMVEVSGQLSNRPDYDPLAAARQSYANLAAAFNRSKSKRR